MRIAYAAQDRKGRKDEQGTRNVWARLRSDVALAVIILFKSETTDESFVPPENSRIARRCLIVKTSTFQSPAKKNVAGDRDSDANCKDIIYQQ